MTTLPRPWNLTRFRGSVAAVVERRGGDPAWLSRAGVGSWPQAADEPHPTLMRTLAASLRGARRLCRDRVPAEDEGDVLVAAAIGEPVPAVHALAGDEQSLAKGMDSLEEGSGFRG